MGKIFKKELFLFMVLILLFVSVSSPVLAQNQSVLLDGVYQNSKNVSVSSFLTLGQFEPLDEIQQDKESVKEMANYIEKSTINLSEKERNTLLNRVKSLIDNGEVVYQGGDKRIFDNAYVRGIKYADGIVQYTVSFTYLDKKNMEQVSMLNVILNEDKNTIFKTYEVNLLKNNQDMATAKMWVDGKLEKNKKVDISEATKYEKENMEVQTASIIGNLNKFKKCVSKCLGNKNISLWAFTAVMGLCGIACTAGVPATAGTACYACVNSAGIIGVNAFMSCWNKCTK